MARYKHPASLTYIRVRCDDTMEKFTAPEFIAPGEIAHRLHHSIVFVIRDGMAFYVSGEGDESTCGSIPTTAREAYAEVRSIEQAQTLARAEAALPV